MLAPKDKYGNRLLPHIVDEIAQSNPDQIWHGLPRDDNDLSKGYQLYTYAQFATAVNRLAFDIESLAGRKSTTHETIAYIGPNDGRYHVMILAAVKAGFQALLISPRNSEEAQLNLFQKTDCSLIAFPESHRRTVTPWLAKREMKTLAVSSLDELVADKNTPHYVYDANFEDSEFDSLVVFHTSGSTGLPKPIVSRHGTWAVMDAYHDLPDFEGRENWIKAIPAVAKSIFIAMPLFHAAGLACTLGVCVQFGVPFLLPPPSKIVSTATIDACLRASGAEAGFLPPSILDEMSGDSASLELLAGLKRVLTGGGAVASHAGEKLVKAGVNFQNLIASTEFMPYPAFEQDPEHWNYFYFQDDVAGLDWRLVGDDVYELYVVRKSAHPGMQTIFFTFPELQEWSTRDLFKKHPSRPHNWTYFGRADNIIVFSNGEKLNPVTIEDALMALPIVKSAVVFGANRLQPGLLIEPHTHPADEEEKAFFLNDVWETVRVINKSSVAHGRIEKDFITLTAPGKELPRAGKGTVQRSLALKLYAEEIDQLYQTNENKVGDAVDIDVQSVETLTSSIQRILSGYLDHPSVGPDMDIFNIGVDSLQTLSLSRLLTAGLKNALGESGHGKLTIAPRMIYQNPTPRRVALSIGEMIGLEITDAQRTSASNGESSTGMHRLIKAYTENLPPASTLSTPTAPAAQDLTIILTGSTGSMGSYLLDLLNNDPRVRKVFALNRARDSQSRQTEVSASRGLDTAFPKTTFFTTDLSKPAFGLSKNEYASMVAETDAIIHNQWQVDFVLSIDSFEPHVCGTRHLIDLSAASAKRPHILLVSTIAAASHWKPASSSEQDIPETALEGLEIPDSEGYGAGKLAASRILDMANTVSGIRTAVVRVGQVTGPIHRPEGSWNSKEWFPSIVASSGHLGMLPESLGAGDEVQWAPVEAQAQMLVDISLSGKEGYFNGVNPRSAPYKDVVLPRLACYFGIKKTVPFPQWVAALAATEHETQTAAEVERNPGVRLLDFYKSLFEGTNPEAPEVGWATARSQAASTTWRELEGVKSEWVDRWLQQWNFPANTKS